MMSKGVDLLRVELVFDCLVEFHFEVKVIDEIPGDKPGFVPRWVVFPSGIGAHTIKFVL